MLTYNGFNVNAYQAGNYLLKINNRNTIARCEIYSKFTIKTPERRQLRRSGVFIVNFEHISQSVLVFLLLTLNMLLTFNFKQGNSGWNQFEMDSTESYLLCTATLSKHLKEKCS